MSQNSVRYGGAVIKGTRFARSDGRLVEGAPTSANTPGWRNDVPADMTAISGGYYYNPANSVPFVNEFDAERGNDRWRSAIITHSEQSQFRRKAMGPGTVSFFRDVSSEASFDFFEVLLRPLSTRTFNLIEKISGTVPWTASSVSLPDAVLYEITWRYLKDASVSTGRDNAYVDRIAFIP